MKRMVLTLVAGLALTAGSVLALDENVQDSSTRVVEKLLELTDVLNKRVGELEKTVEQQKSEIARLKTQLRLTQSVQNQKLKFLPGQPLPNLNFTPETTPVPGQPPQRLWHFPEQSDPNSPAIPPGSVPREINGIRYYIVPCDSQLPGVSSTTPPATTPEGSVSSTSPVPIRVVIPASR